MALSICSAMVLPVIRSLSFDHDERPYSFAITSWASLNFRFLLIVVLSALLNFGCRRLMRSRASVDPALDCFSSSRACCLGTSRCGFAGRPRETVDITFLLFNMPVSAQRQEVKFKYVFDENHTGGLSPFPRTG